jgi:glycosyltransferase involved in cell wall biosynthesis
VLTLAKRYYHDVWDELGRRAQLDVIELAHQAKPGELPQFSKARHVVEIAKALVVSRKPVLRAMRESDVVILHTHALLPALVHLRTSRRRGRQATLLSTGLSFRSEPLMRLYGLLARVLGARQVTFLADNGVQVDMLRRYFALPADHVRLVPVGFDRGGHETRHDGYVFTGGYSNRDFHTVIEAFRGSPHRLVLCAVPENDLPDDIPDNVQIVFNETPEEFSHWLAGAEVGIVPIHPDRGGSGFSVLVEHYYHGQPTIVTDDPSMRDYAAADSTIFVSPYRADAMREAVGRLMADDALRHRLGAAARARYDETYSAASFVGRIEAVMAEVAA